MDPQPYYRSALTALRFVEARHPTGRRFGAEADARWTAFRGDLADADRLDLLIRDADAQWPGAFGPRSVFALPAVAEDDPFGKDWLPLDPVEGAELWREGTRLATAPSSAAQLFDAVAAHWSITLQRPAASAPGAAARLLVAGPGAVAALVDALAGRTDLDWSAQVLVVATTPAHRQLAALASPALNLTRVALVLTAQQGRELAAAAPQQRKPTQEDARAPDRWRGAPTLVSSDASDEDRQAVDLLASA